MEKNWTVAANNGSKTYKTIAEAEDRAKKLAGNTQTEYLIYELVSYTKTPATNIDIVPVIASTPAPLNPAPTPIT